MITSTNPEMPKSERDSMINAINRSPKKPRFQSADYTTHDGLMNFLNTMPATWSIVKLDRLEVANGSIHRAIIDTKPV